MNSRSKQGISRQGITRRKMIELAAVTALAMPAAQALAGEAPSTPPDGAQDMGGGTPPSGDAGAAGGSGGAGGESQSTVEGQLGSWNMGGTDASTVDGDDYAYDAALYVTADGIDEDKSDTSRISAGTYDATSATGVTIDDDVSGHNGILIYNAPYTVSNATINLLTSADGTDTCDFSGKGTAIATFGESAVVEISDSSIHTAGVATMPLFTDAGATVTLRNSTIQSDGGTLYSSYLNTPSQTVMVAPPWILGIMGTSRASNVMGTNTTFNALDCTTSAGAWAVLSTDAGSNMAMNVFNTSLTLNNTDESAATPLQADGGQITETLDNPYTENYGTGYGTYVIGSAVETFRGATFNVGTYATIFTGGSATYGALEAGQTYDLANAAGTSTGTYEAAESKVTTINSDTFGFMVHQNANTINVIEGTQVNTGYATFLVKSGASSESLTATVDNAEISNGGVLIQVMDNDDATNGGMMATDDEANTNGGSQNFIPYHDEDAGFNTAAATSDGSAQSFTFTNGSYAGNIYNASGSNGLSGTTLGVTLGAGATLSGAVAQTSAIHVTYDGSQALKDSGAFAFADAEEAATFADQYQNTHFTIEEYYGIGQVANLVCDNGANVINMTLTNDAVWNVTGASYVSSLAIADDAQVVVGADATLTVGGQEYSDCTLTADSLGA